MNAKFLKLELCLLILGFAAGIGWVLLSTLFASWTYVGSVQGIPMQIFYAYGGHDKPIYVRNSNSKIFSCSEAHQTCILVSDDKILDRSSGFTKDKNNALTPFPPGNVLIWFIGRDGGYEWMTKRYILALDNGSIRTWEDKGFGDLSLIVSGFCGAVMGFWLGIIFLIFSPLFRSRPHMKAKNDFKQP